MGALPLTDAVQRAQDAMSGGNYRLAIETCRRLLDQFPEYVVAYQLLGEAHLEQRQADEAERAFQEALRRDPQNVASYVGLGLIAEERQDPRTALAYMQAAWEIDPRRPELRNHVVRLAPEVYNAEGRLQLTRAGLSSLHSSAGRWGRAVNECAATLAEHPDRVDVRLRLAEALWRRGEDDRAAATCQNVLERAPQAVVALLILADIERRRGNADEAQALRDRARAADPDGAQASALFADGTDEQISFFIPEEIPQFQDDARPVAEPERPRIAPAPDFTSPEPVRTLEPVAAPEPEPEPEHEVVAEVPADLGAELSLPSDAELESARPAEIAPKGYTGLLRSLEGEGFEPFSATDFGVEPLAPEAFEPTDALVEPEVSEPVMEEAPQEVVAEEDLAGMLGVSSDTEIEAALPPEELPHGYTTLLRSIEDDGLEPFDVSASGPTEPALTGDEDAILGEVPSLEDELAVPEPEPEPEPEPATAPTSGLDASEVAADWDQIDEEIRSAIPGEMPRGYTDQLRSIDAAGVEPFSFDDEEIPFFQRMKPRPQPEAAADESPAPVAPAAEERTLTEADLLDDLGDIDDLRLLDEQPEEAVEEDLDLLSAADLADLEGMVAEPTDLADAPTDELMPDDPTAELEEVVAEPEPAAEAETEAGEDLVIEGLDAATAWETAEPQPGADILSPEGAAERLGVGPELFDRARQAKEELIDLGEISVEAPEPEPEPVAEEPATAPVSEPEVAPVASAAVADPDSPQGRAALAATLAEQGEFDAVLEQCRWVQRHAPELIDDIIPVLSQLTAEESTVAAGAHRLLGAIYRRRGQVHLASNHYSLSLSVQRSAGGKRG